MQTIKLPYEMLARWDQKGILRGAHIQWRYVTRDGDKVVSEAVSAAEPVAVADHAGGFPLADLMNEMQVAALVAVDEADAGRASANTARAAAEDALRSVKAELASARAEIAALQSALIEATKPKA